MFIIIFFLLLFAGNIQTRIIQALNSSNINDTDRSQPPIIHDNYNDNIEINVNRNQSSTQIVDQNQFAETVVDLLFDLLEKANLSRTVSVIHNDTELTELME